MRIHASALTLVVWLCAVAAQATLLLYEPFEYNVKPINGMKGTAEVGFAAGSTWSYTGTQTADIYAGSIYLGRYPTRGNQARHRSNGADTGSITRPMNVVSGSGDLWFSCLTKITVASPSTNLLSGVTIDNGTGSATNFGIKGCGVTAGTAGVHPTLTCLNANKSVAVASGNGSTYMLVAKYPNLGSAGQVTKFWALGQPEYETLMGNGGVTETELDARIVANSRTTLTAGPPALAGTERLRLWFIDRVNVGTADNYFDEIRLGTTLADVFPALPVIWQGTDRSSLWSSTTNWTSLQSPTNGAPITFTNNKRLTNTNNLPWTSIGALTFSSGGFLIRGNPLTLNGNILNASGANTWAIDSKLGVAVAQTNASGSSSLTFAGRFDLNGQTLTIGGDGGGTTFSGPVVGSGSLVKNGLCSVIWSSTNSTCTGTVTVNNGQFLATNARGFAAGTAAVQVVKTAAAGTVLGGLGGTYGGLVTMNTGTLLRPGTATSGANAVGTVTFAGGLTLTAGAILDLDVGTKTDLVRVSGGVLAVTGPVTVKLNSTLDLKPDVPYVLMDWTGAAAPSLDAGDFTLSKAAAIKQPVKLYVKGKRLVLQAQKTTLLMFR